MATAQADIDLLVAFLQTRHDPTAFADVAGTTSWLQERGLLSDGQTVQDDDLRTIRRFRAALSGLFQEAQGGDADERTHAVIEGLIAESPFRVSVGDHGVLRLVPIGQGVTRALAELVAAAYRVSLTPEFQRLKLCKACGYAFYDSTKNRSRVWCDMALCGSQEKARAYRQRLKQRSPSGPKPETEARA